MLARKLKKILKKKVVPEFLYQLYFRRQIRLRRKALFDQLTSEKDLLGDMTKEQQEYWRERIDQVIAAPDNASIPRVTEAGKLVDRQLIMHNGIRVDPLSYYSYPMLKMLMQNKGVHEPQEEKIFQEVLSALSSNKKLTILELGSYWAFYSMWFQQVIPGAHCFMVEPDRQNLFFGKENFRLNGFKGDFQHYGIGRKEDLWNNITTVDQICSRRKVGFVDILHADIQGFELDMLHGATNLFESQRVGYVFISTHSNDLHTACRTFLSGKYQFQTVASVDLDESYSWDGILVMKAPDYPGPARVEVSKKQK